MPATRGLILLVTLASASGAGAQEVRYSYDRNGEVAKVEYNGGGSISYTYDAAGRLIRRVFSGTPASGAFATVSSASFAAGRPVAPGMIVSGFGSGLAAAVAVASSSPLPTDLGETTVEIVDSAGASHLAPLFAVAPTQINYLVPAETALGQASVTVKSGGSIVGQDTLDVAAISPGLYSANYTGSGVAAAFALVISGASRTQTLVFDPNTAGAVPIDLGGPQDEVYLLLFGTGIRGFRNQVTAAVGGNAVPVLGAVPQGEFPGLDQVNIGPLPKSLAGKGSVDVILTVDGTGTNPLTVSIR